MQTGDDRRLCAARGQRATRPRPGGRGRCTKDRPDLPTGIAGYVATVTVETNDVIRTTAECWELCRQGNTERAAELLRPNFVHDDRRTGLANKLTNRDDTIVNNCLFIEMGFSIELEPVAVHGDRLALCRALFMDASGNEIVTLQVLTLDEDGLRTSCVSFDESDLAGAMAELESLRRNP